MTTGKRQIPINGHSADGIRKDDRPGQRDTGHPGSAGVRPSVDGTAPQAGSAHGAAGAHSAGSSTKTSSTGPHGRHDKSAPSAAKASPPDAIIAERDALAAERDALVSERDALKAQVEALTDSRLRLQAEFENFRKRASREAVESYVRTQCEVLSDFLPVLDNLERALDAAEHHEEGKVLTGVRMTRDMFVDLLTRVGVEEIEGVGAPFDPEVHDAVAVQPSDHEEGVVAAVLERGYRQGERVLRPARVVVSAGRAEPGSGGGTPAAAGAVGSGGGTVSD